MTIDSGQANLAVCCSFVDELATNGLTHAIICPGSRSTPLAIALAAHEAVTIWVQVDERSAAFFALGMARQLAQPVTLLCTSGTAAANFVPAIAEASLSRIPLLVLTADRPPELRAWGAAQTIDQIGLYGSHVKWFVDMPVPDGDPGLLHHARATAARALSTAALAPAGPVHLNFPFREPLLPPDLLPPLDLSALFTNGRRREVVQPLSPHAAAVPHDSLIDDIAALIATYPRGIIVAGPVESPAFATSRKRSPSECGSSPATPPVGAMPASTAVQQTSAASRSAAPSPFQIHLGAYLASLSAMSGYPVLADPLSGLRFGSHHHAGVIDSYDSFLRDATTAESLAPEIVIRVGAPPTSKPLQQFLASHPGTEHIVIDAGPPRDPHHLATRYLTADPAETICRISAAATRFSPPPDREWLDCWRETDALTGQTISARLAAIDELFEGRACAEVAALLPDDATLVVGNSMPVRDVDTFVRGDARRLRIVGTRGANGIDGVVSTALGAAAVSDGPVALVLGDLSFYHDLNGLLAAAQNGLSATIVVLNNDGGGIFSFLPQSHQLAGELFETLFGTPIGLDVAAAAALYGCAFARPQTWEAFRCTISSSLAQPGVSIIEVVTDRQRNVQLHRAISAAVTDSLHESNIGITLNA